MSDTTRITPATLSDVARAAGVSLATASRSLNGSSRRVNDAYRQRVLDAAAELKYSPNLPAQAVARGTTITIALLVSEIADPCAASVTSGVVAEADRERLIVTIAATEHDRERGLDLVRQLRGQRPRAMILACPGLTCDLGRAGRSPDTAELIAELTAYEQAGGRVVLVGANEFGFRTVEIDDPDLAASGIDGALPPAGTPARLSTVRAPLEQVGRRAIRLAVESTDSDADLVH